MTDEPSAQPLESWLAIEAMQPCRGMFGGMRQPSLLVSLRLEGDADAERLATLQRGLERLRTDLPEIGKNDLPPAPQGSAWTHCLALVADMADRLLIPSGIAIGDFSKVVRTAPDSACNTAMSVLQIPTLRDQEGQTRFALRQLKSLIDEAMAGGAQDTVKPRISVLARRLAASFIYSRTMLILLRGSALQGVPMLQLPGDVVQLGQGCRSRWIESTLTDRTPAISVKFAREKALCNQRLRQAGLPVPTQHVIASEDQAVAFAAELGYPVVVKPADLDQGLGVTADLRDESELRAAYSLAASKSKNILIEQHIEGRDYRLIVFEGELLWTIERVPAGVTGDGRKTVQELIDETNADPARGKTRDVSLHEIELDDDARLMLDRQSLALEDVPAAGRFVKLARIANVSRGGMPVAMNERVHPDNRQLVIDAAAALRLDLAGIDLLMPDIAVSWHEGGAAICEVNAKPQLGNITASHLGKPIVAGLLGEKSRIPVVAVIGDDAGGTFVADLAARVHARGIAVGYHDRSGVRIGETALVHGATPLFAAGEMLVTDRRTEAAILSVTEGSILPDGLPVDRIDWLVIAGTNVTADRSDRAAFQGTFSRLVSLTAAHCNGTLLVLSGAGIDVPHGMRGAPGMTVMNNAPKREDAIALIADGIAAAHSAASPPPPEG